MDSTDTYSFVSPGYVIGKYDQFYAAQNLMDSIYETHNFMDSTVWSSELRFNGFNGYTLTCISSGF